MMLLKTGDEADNEKAMTMTVDIDSDNGCVEDNNDNALKRSSVDIYM